MRLASVRPASARVAALHGACLLAVLAPSTAAAQQIKGQVMVILDTSGSMAEYLTVPPNGGNAPNGDGSQLYTDVNGMQNLYPGKVVNGRTVGRFSRMYAAKQALTNAVGGYSGTIDFGLMTFDFRLCPFNQPLCNNSSFVNGAGQTRGINWASPGCSNTQPILVTPGAGSGAKILPWINGVEDHRSSNDGNMSFRTNNNANLGSTPLDPEIRPAGFTPLAASLRSALAWYNGVVDPLKSCRPYTVILETDGDETCDGGGDAAVPVAARNLWNANPANRVKTYVIGIAGGNLINNLNAIAAAGGTSAARIANDQTAIETAYADILADSVKYEVCNERDDNCNNVIDEGFDKGAACAAGLGVCARLGVRKCDPMNNTQTTCCTDDGNPACVPLVPGPPRQEVCNGLDDDCDGEVDEDNVCQGPACTPELCNGKDDDCDGVIDNAPIDVGRPCGLNLGICRPGLTTCLNSRDQDVSLGAAADVGDRLVCKGGVPPRVELCNNVDDDCDGVVDGMTEDCYSGPLGTAGVGQCLPGRRVCTAGMFGMCIGELKPTPEFCDGLDNNCNGKIDDVPGAGAVCCPSNKCGVGICKAGTMQCSGGALACIGAQGALPEACNGLDDDCNGQTDELPNLGKDCQPQMGCAGVLACDVMKMQIVCNPVAMGSPEICNGKDDNCNGLVDEDAEVAKNDARIGKPCGANMGLVAPCSQGTYVCKGGTVVCQGEIGPQPETCDCRDNNCNGEIDDNALCPDGTTCYQCGCYKECAMGGQFGDCPGGYECDDKGYCVPITACIPACPDGFECRAGVCKDRCESVNCPPKTRCERGSCVDDTCLSKGCPAGKRCNRVDGECVDDLCAAAACKAGEYCNPRDGRCVRGCGDIKCADTEICIEGRCAPDLCAAVQCKYTESCVPVTGECKPNTCLGRAACPAGLVCVAGECIDDLCARTQCPPGFRCTTSPVDGSVSCDKPKVREADKDNVLGTGGGGLALGCSAGGGRGREASPLPSLVALGLAALILRRRR